MSKTFSKASINSEAAQQLLRAAEAKAADLGVKACFAVVDDAGHLKAFLRMDGAAFTSVKLAQEKAYAAVGFGIPTLNWKGAIGGDPFLGVGLSGYQGVSLFGGGVPLMVDGSLAGAFAASGGSPEQDHEIAETAAASLG